MRATVKQYSIIVRTRKKKEKVRTKLEQEPDPKTIINSLGSSRVVVPKEDRARLDSDAGGRTSRLNGSHVGYGSGGGAYGHVIKLQPGFGSRSVEE